MSTRYAMESIMANAEPFRRIPSKKGTYMHTGHSRPQKSWSPLVTADSFIKAPHPYYLRSRMMAVGDVFPPTSLPKCLLNPAGLSPSYTWIVFVGEYRPPSLPRSLDHASLRLDYLRKANDRRLYIVVLEGRLPSPNIVCPHQQPCTPRSPISRKHITARGADRYW
ncbi:hypothetical protein PAXINDRAFT_166613 [Paxillus involutus ATCC 200175]|nr:hypothetical protein PAXINDRAFT_166613 [Paxillus involutus ATCC 200175]